MSTLTGQETSGPDKDWEVTRNCCPSGMCLVCRGHNPRPIRIVHATCVSREYADQCAANWTRDGYAAKAQRIDGKSCPDCGAATTETGACSVPCGA